MDRILVSFCAYLLTLTHILPTQPTHFQVHNHEFVRPSFPAGSQNGPIIPDLAGQVTLGGLSTPIVSCPRPVIAACVAVTSTVFQVVSIVPVV